MLTHPYTLQSTHYLQCVWIVVYRGGSRLKVDQQLNTSLDLLQPYTTVMHCTYTVCALTATRPISRVVFNSFVVFKRVPEQHNTIHSIFYSGRYPGAKFFFPVMKNAVCCVAVCCAYPITNEKKLYMTFYLLHFNHVYTSPLFYLI